MVLSGKNMKFILCMIRGWWVSIMWSFSWEVGYKSLWVVFKVMFV